MIQLQLIPKKVHQELLTKSIIEEISFALGAKKEGFVSTVITPLLHRPTQKMAGILADFYHMVITESPRAAAIFTLPRFEINVDCTTSERIPPEGPLLLLANHPGGLDSLGILSCVPRKDIKVLVSDVNLLRHTDYLNRHMIFVDFKTIGGMEALRQAINHLRNNGALLLFARGEVEPDPSFMAGAIESINKWSASIEILLHKVPQTFVQIVLTGGAILPKFYTHFLTKLRRNPETRQKLAEFVQVISSAISPGNSSVNMKINASKPRKFVYQESNHLMPDVINWAKQEMQEFILGYKP